MGDWPSWIQAMASIITMILGFVVFYQIKDSQIKFNLTIDRDKAKLASEQMLFFNTQIVNLDISIHQIYAKYNVKHVTLGDIYKDIVEPHQVSFTNEAVISKIGHEGISKIFEERKNVLYTEVANLYNLLEAFSTIFVHDLADENIGFRVNGKAFCNMIEKYYFEFSVYFPAADIESNVSILYKRWKLKLNAHYRRFAGI